MALSRPRTTRRVLRGSALGVGLLVVGGFTAPAAFAIDGPVTEEAPAQDAESPAPLSPMPSGESPALAPALSGDFGTGKEFTARVTPHGPVPDDLDLSGAVFRATPLVVEADVERLADPVSYTCTTDVAGECSFESDAEPPPMGLPRFLTAERSDATLPVGTYTLAQVESSPGLAVNTGSASFTLCDTWFCGGDGGDVVPVEDDSLFRTSLVTTVTDAETDEPLACAGYALSGPDYPHDGTAPEAEPVTGTVPPECADPSPSPTTSPTTTAAPTSSSSPTSSAPTTTTEVDLDEDAEPADSSGIPSTTSATSTTESSPASPTSIVLDLAAADEPLVDFGTQTSDGTGTMTFPGWFLPTTGYLLTPTTTPAGYAPDVTDAFGITTTAQEAAARQPAAVVRALVTTLAAGASPTSGGGAAGAAPATTSAPAAAGFTGTSSAVAAAADPAALAVTGSPVVTMALVGGGLVALGGSALLTGSTLRRRARQRA